MVRRSIQGDCAGNSIVTRSSIVWGSCREGRHDILDWILKMIIPSTKGKLMEGVTSSKVVSIFVEIHQWGDALLAPFVLGLEKNMKKLGIFLLRGEFHDLLLSRDFA